jgi:hypothetical protein
MRRFAYWWRVVRAGSLVVWSIVGVILAFVGGSLLLTTDWALKHRLWGVILVAVAILAAVLEGSYREIRRLEQDLRKQPLKPRYDRSPLSGTDDRWIEHRVGILNPAGNAPATGVRLEWTEMSPRPQKDPRSLDPLIQLQIPCAVQRLTGGGDPAIGISLLPGQEELWVILTTLGRPTIMAASYGSRGEHGDAWNPWRLEPSKEWRLSYRIVADNLPSTLFDIVMTAANGKVECELER